MRVTNTQSATLSSLLGAIALTIAAAPLTVHAEDKPKMEKCYGVAKAGKNDCASGSLSCAGHATKDFDKEAFVKVPAGLCEKLAGGSSMPSK